MNIWSQKFRSKLPKIAFFIFGLVIMNFKKLEYLHHENDKLDHHKLKYFQRLSHSLFYGAKIVSKILFQIIIEAIRLELRNFCEAPFMQ